MAGTTAAIARLLRDRSLTLAECARMLGLNRAQLDERLFLMERQGYLARAAPQKDEPCTCSGCCATCYRKGGRAEPAVFTLTAKGEKLIPDNGN